MRRKLRFLYLDISFWLFCIPILISLCLYSAVSIGLMMVIRSRYFSDISSSNSPVCPVRILIPVKGLSGLSKQILETLLIQDYPDYEVTFVLENQSDPAFELIKGFCLQYPHAEIFLSGKTTQCGQKNYGLAKAVSNLNDYTKILVFCDSTNSTDRGWLGRITYPIRTGAVEACTTFRCFDPHSGQLGGICQALYAATVFALITIAPKPWGGGTAILKATFDRLDVAQTWLKTVVDDLTLGNLLETADIKIRVSPENFLSSPLQNQSIKGFLLFLDRQILYPKFTNPWIWFFSVLSNVFLSLSLLFSSFALLFYLFAHLEAKYALMAATFWACFVFVGNLLRIVNRPKLPVFKSFLGMPILVFLSTFVCIRSVFINHIDWHGARYYCGKGGQVIRVESIGK